MTGAGAALGAVWLEGASAELFALIEGAAAGAMLTMVAETMLPEAFHKGAVWWGFLPSLGFCWRFISIRFEESVAQRHRDPARQGVTGSEQTKKSPAGSRAEERLIRERRGGLGGRALHAD